jgi:hypothetical protein
MAEPGQIEWRETLTTRITPDNFARIFDSQLNTRDRFIVVVGFASAVVWAYLDLILRLTIRIYLWVFDWIIDLIGAGQFRFAETRIIHWMETASESFGPNHLPAYSLVYTFIFGFGLPILIWRYRTTLWEALTAVGSNLNLGRLSIAPNSFSRLQEGQKRLLTPTTQSTHSRIYNHIRNSLVAGALAVVVLKVGCLCIKKSTKVTFDELFNNLSSITIVDDILVWGIGPLLVLLVYFHFMGFQKVNKGLMLPMFFILYQVGGEPWRKNMPSCLIWCQFMLISSFILLLSLSILYIFWSGNITYRTLPKRILAPVAKIYNLAINKIFSKTTRQQVHNYPDNSPRTLAESTKISSLIASPSKLPKTKRNNTKRKSTRNHTFYNEPPFSIFGLVFVLFALSSVAYLLLAAGRLEQTSDTMTANLASRDTHSTLEDAATTPSPLLTNVVDRFSNTEIEVLESIRPLEKTVVPQVTKAASSKEEQPLRSAFEKNFNINNKNFERSKRSSTLESIKSLDSDLLYHKRPTQSSQKDHAFESPISYEVETETNFPSKTNSERSNSPISSSKTETLNVVSSTQIVTGDGFLSRGFPQTTCKPPLGNVYNCAKIWWFVGKLPKALFRILSIPYLFSKITTGVAWLRDIAKHVLNYVLIPSDRGRPRRTSSPSAWINILSGLVIWGFNWILLGISKKVPSTVPVVRFLTWLPVLLFFVYYHVPSLRSKISSSVTKHECREDSHLFYYLILLCGMKAIKKVPTLVSYFMYDRQPSVPATPTFRPDDVTIIVPVCGTFPDAREFKSSIIALLANRTYGIYIITDTIVNHNNARHALKDVGGGRWSLVPATTGSSASTKGELVAQALQRVSTRIACITDMTVSWNEVFLASSLAAFEDPVVTVLGSARQAARNTSGGPWRNLNDYLACSDVRQQDTKNLGEYNIDGQVSRIPDSTWMGRTEVLGRLHYRKSLMDEPGANHLKIYPNKDHYKMSYFAESGYSMAWIHNRDLRDRPQIHLTTTQRRWHDAVQNSKNHWRDAIYGRHFHYNPFLAFTFLASKILDNEFLLITLVLLSLLRGQNTTVECCMLLTTCVLFKVSERELDTLFMWYDNRQYFKTLNWAHWGTITEILFFCISVFVWPLVDGLVSFAGLIAFLCDTFWGIL